MIKTRESGMDDGTFDERLRLAAAPLVDQRLSVIEVQRATELAEPLPLRRGFDGFGLSMIALIGLALLAIRLGGFGDVGGTSRAAIDVDGNRLSARSVGAGIEVSILPPEATAPVLVTVAQYENFAVRQLMCSHLPLSHVVLFGVAPTSARVEVAGLGDGTIEQVDTGVFLFATAADPGPGTEWTVTSGGGATISGHVAGGGPRMSSDVPSASAPPCFAYDPSVEALKP